jgi:hypothetical protein
VVLTAPGCAFEEEFGTAAEALTGTTIGAANAGLVTCDYGSRECNPPVDNVAGSFVALWGDNPSAQGFHLRSGNNSVHMLDPSGHSQHPQSIQRFDGDRFAVTSSGYEGELVLAHIGILSEASGTGYKLGRTLNVYGRVHQMDAVYARLGFHPWKHAGGSQILGDRYLFIGLEAGGPTLGRLGVVDLQDPYGPRRLYENEIGFSHTAGAVGVTKLADGRMLVVVGEKNSDTVYFYRSSSTTLLGGTGWQLMSTIRRSDFSTSSCGCGGTAEYQNLQLVNQSDGTVFMIGFDRNLADMKDWGDVYRLSIRSDVTISAVVKVAHEHFVCGPNDSACNFMAGAGVYVDPCGRLNTYALPMDNDGSDDSHGLYGSCPDGHTMITAAFESGCSVPGGGGGGGGGGDDDWECTDCVYPEAF